MGPQPVVPVEVVLMQDPREAPQPGRDTFQDVVNDFLLAERELLEKEQRGEPTTGDRAPTRGRFELVDALADDHRSEEHTSELQSRGHLVCRLLLEKKKS